MKQPTEITVRMPEELVRRLIYLSEAEHRTPAAQITLLVRNACAYFERAKGKMDPKGLAAIDLSAYLSPRADTTSRDEPRDPA